MSLLVFVGFCHQRTLRFLGYAALLSFVSIFQMPVNAFRQLKFIERWWAGFPVILRYAKITVLPLLIFFVFFVLYSFANPHFSNITESILDSLINFFSQFNLNPQLFWTIVFGCVFGGAIFYPVRFEWFQKFQGLHQEELVRTRRPWPIGFTFGMNALKNEYRMGLILLSILNGLLLLVNLIDLRFIWAPGEDLSPATLSNYVHEGTYILILTILLAITVLLFWFRNNLNFFPNNKKLKQLSYAWIAQNAWLALSVAVRNFHYVYAYGLTYKRIGVFFFLLVVIAGLFLLYLKIRDKKTLYFLFAKNAEIIFFGLLLMGLMNWNMLVTRYNLKYTATNGIDVSYLLYDLPDTNWYLLNQHRAKLEAASTSDYSDYVEKGLDRKKQRLANRVADRDWRAWNWPDYWNMRQFTGDLNVK